MTGMTRIGLGTYPMSGGYGRMDGAQLRATVDAAADHGVTHIDTAESYGVEEHLGPLLRGRRDGFFLATRVFPARPYTFAHLRSALEGSLRRLGTDHVDLFQLHGMENAVIGLPCTDPAELGSSLAQLLATGLTRRVGVCNYSAADLHAWPRTCR
jgi:aryl-alcohol dehydrogenase-like predicted oxidoreductase